MTKFKETESESESLLSVHVNEVHIFNTKTNEGGKRYGVSVLGYDSGSMDYKPADIMIKTFSTKEAARVFAKNLIELIEGGLNYGGA